MLRLGGDVHLLRGLLLSFQALRAAAMAYETERVRACTPADLFGLPLPGGGTLGAALGTLRRQDPESARRLQSILTGGRNREDLEAEEDPAAQTSSVTYQGLASAALQAAWRHEGVVWSADREEWRAVLSPVGIRVIPPTHFADAPRRRTSPIRFADAPRRRTSPTHFVARDFAEGRA